MQNSKSKIQDLTNTPQSGVLNRYKLFLDDIRTPKDAYGYTKYDSYMNDKWNIVRSYDQFTKHITSEFDKGSFPEIISFDHDLADEHYSDKMYGEMCEYNKLYEHFKEKTGYDCVKWLVGFCIDNQINLPKFVVHSMNPVGGKNITNYLINFMKHKDKFI